MNNIFFQQTTAENSLILNWIQTNDFIVVDVINKGLEIREHHFSLLKLTQQQDIISKKVFVKLWENLARIFRALA